MTSVLADTQTVIWYLHDPSKLSPVTLQALNTAARDHRLFVSAITLVEIRLEVEAGRLPQNVWDGLRKVVSDSHRPLTVLPVDAIVAEALGPVALTDNPDMPGRIIAATAVAHELRLVSMPRAELPQA